MYLTGSFKGQISAGGPVSAIHVLRVISCLLLLFCLVKEEEHGEEKFHNVSVSSKLNVLYFIMTSVDSTYVSALNSFQMKI